MDDNHDSPRIQAERYYEASKKRIDPEMWVFKILRNQQAYETANSKLSGHEKEKSKSDKSRFLIKTFSTPLVGTDIDTNRIVTKVNEAYKYSQRPSRVSRIFRNDKRNDLAVVVDSVRLTDVKSRFRKNELS